MLVIYFDNFRGFTNTFLPLRDVNFFVGENSTGKTSILKLIKLLSLPQFWLKGEFNSEEVDLGYYSEIASFSENQKQKYFDIAIFDSDKTKYQTIHAIKLRCIDKSGLAMISEITLIKNDVNLQLVLDEKEMKYRYDFLHLDDLDHKTKTEFLKKWVFENNLDKKDFIIDKQTSHFYKEALILYVQSLIASLKKENKGNRKKTNLSIEFPSFLKHVAWLAPIRTDPKRTYDSYTSSFNPNGTHAPYLLKKMLTRNSEVQSKEQVETILQKFGKDSGLFDRISIKSLGNEDTSPFEIQVHFKDQPIKITNVGYGVSQILPVVVEIIARFEDSWFAIQQPEIHLHPKGQAAFGDFVLKSAVEENKKFIIETHSDFTIDRFRFKLNQLSKSKKKSKISAQIVYFERSNNKNQLTCISILKDGSLPESQPANFRNFFIKEQLDLLEI